MARRPTPILDAIERKHPNVGGLLRTTVERTLDRQDVPILAKDVPEAAAKVVSAIENSSTVAVVEVKSTWLSKINAAQAGGFLASVATVVGLDLTADQAAYVILGIQGAVALATFILKTWFTKTVTPQSKPA